MQTPREPELVPARRSRMRSLPAVLLLTVLVIATLTGCSPKSEPTTVPASATPGSQSPTATPTASIGSPMTEATSTLAPASATSTVAAGGQVIEFSRPSLAESPITFRVRVPDNTPQGESVYVSIDSIDSGFVAQHVELEPEGDGVFSGQVMAGDGAMLRYAYTRWDGTGCCDGRNMTREVYFTGEPLPYRLLVVEPGDEVVEDVVPAWNDLQTEFEQVEVSGKVVDAATGDPLMEVEVSVGGIHVATRYDGTFTVPGLVPGPHRIVAYTVKGDYRTVQREIELGSAELSGIELRLEHMDTVRVRFTAHLPAGTPDDVAVFIAGNLWQIGGRPGYTNSPAIPSGINMPMLERNGDVATGTFDLPAGAYVEYFYTLGSDVAAEGKDFNRRFRSFVVGEQDMTRSDDVAYWGNPDWPTVTIRVNVPANTPAGVNVYLHNGPTYRMNQTGPEQWVTAMNSHPPGAEYRYRISLGDEFDGRDGSPAADEIGERSFIVPDEDTEIVIDVTRWKELPDPTARNESGGLMVTFRLSVPLDTPSGAEILLFGNRPAIDADGTVMQPVPGNPWLYEAEVNFDHDGDLLYRYSVTGAGLSSSQETVFTGYDGQVVNDYVSAWDGDPGAPRDGWISGIYMPDYWSEAFLNTSASTFDAAKEANGEWVAISSVWSFGRIQPDPVLESRPVLTWTVLTPIEDIRAQAAVAREKGMRIFLAPQMNPEVHSNWQQETVEAGSREWWTQWLEQAEAQWMWNAIVAEQIGAELLMLPGYVFHVFPPTGFFTDPDYAPEFDRAVQAMILKVREIYSGKLLISGSQRDYDFPGLADYIGVTTYDVGPPNDLPADSSVADLRAYYADRFEETVDASWERWGKPVMFYTIHVPAKPREGDENGQLFQAAGHEAIFQEIAERPYVIGSFSWSYSMIGASEFETDGVRGRTAEAVLAKWYEILGRG